MKGVKIHGIQFYPTFVNVAHFLWNDHTKIMIFDERLRMWTNPLKFVVYINAIYPWL